MVPMVPMPAMPNGDGLETVLFPGYICQNMFLAPSAVLLNPHVQTLSNVNLHVSIFSLYSLVDAKEH